jgi:hypothetical protein
MHHHGCQGLSVTVFFSEYIIAFHNILFLFCYACPGKPPGPANWPREVRFMTPMQILKFFLPETGFWDVLMNQTNLYAEQKLKGKLCIVLSFPIVSYAYVFVFCVVFLLIFSVDYI